MIRSFFLLLAICFTLSLSAQDATYAAVDVPAPAPTASVAFRQQPQFIGGPAAFREFLSAEVAYPALAEDYAIEGTVIVTVRIDERGVPHTEGVARSLFPACDEAALAAAERLPRFLPAVRDGQPVARILHVPFRFSLR